MRNMVQESEREDRCAVFLVELLYFAEVLVYTHICPFVYRLLLRTRKKGLDFISLFTVQILNYIKNKSFLFDKSQLTCRLVKVWN